MADFAKGLKTLMRIIKGTKRFPTITEINDTDELCEKFKDIFGPIADEQYFMKIEEFLDYCSK